MTGPFVAHETLLECPKCCRIFTCPALRSIVPGRCKTAWDVVVFVGRSLFQHHRLTEQVRRDLLSRNVSLSLSHIDYLGRKFIAYLAMAHRQAVPRINCALQRAGGYILHLDATHEADAPALMTGMDSLSRFVLANVKLPSEHAKDIIPFLRQLKRDYGVPIACVHDMGTGITKAVTEVFPDTRDFICHFHFLRDVGKDLLDPAYRQLRKVLRTYAASTKLAALVREVLRSLGAKDGDTPRFISAIIRDRAAADLRPLPWISTYSLALWCLHGKKNGDGYGFPFDRPLLEFAKRIMALIDCLPDLMGRLPARGRIGNRLFFKLARQVLTIGADPLFESAVRDLEWRCQLFDDLRKKMRIAPIDGPNALNDDGTCDVITIRQGVSRFRGRLEKEPKFSADPLCRKMADQIDKYSETLFAEPIEVNTTQGPVTLYPQRTNNMLEQFFRSLRRGHRRKTGNNSMRRALQSMLADTPLIKNLDNPDYMKILLAGKPALEQLFADLELNPCNPKEMPVPGVDRILPGFRKLLNLQNLPDQINRLALRSAA